MNKPEVTADVKIIPAKREATYEVPVESDRGRPRRLLANVQASQIGITSTWPGNRENDRIAMPRTLEACDALSALVAAVRAELVEQGVSA